MTIVNTRERAGENSEHIFELSITDTNAHDLPDVDGDDSDGGDGFSIEGVDDMAVKIVNTLDQSVDVTLQSTNYGDASFSEPYEPKKGVTVASGGGVDVISPDFPGPADLVRIQAVCSTAPTSGSVKVVFMTNHDGR